MHLKYMRFAAIFFFLCGLLLFGTFTGINTYAENHKQLQKSDDILIHFNTKTRQLNVNGVKLIIDDTTVQIGK